VPLPVSLYLPCSLPYKRPLSGLLLCFTQRPPYPTHGVRRSLVSPPNGICMSALAEPLCLQTRPAPWIIRELPPSLTAYHVTLCFHAGRFLPLSNVWSTVVVGGGETRTASHKAVCFKTKGSHNGANPLHSPSLKNRKSHLALPSVRTLRQKPRARVELSGLNLSLLTATL